MADISASAGKVFQALPVDPATGAPSGEAIYDQLMQKIEPELTSAMLPTLEAKYKNETAEEKKARGARYAAAFDKYDEAYKKFMEEIRAETAKFQHEALHSLEQENRTKEEAELSSLESAISTL